jgi:hypothetical protein
VTLTRRRPREVYRVYSEEEYLAGVDPFAEWDAPRAQPVGGGRRLQRFAGAAALTGAVGTVGGVIGLAGLHAHAGARGELAERAVPSIRIAPPRTGVNSVHVTARQVARRSRRRRGHGDVRPIEVALVSVRRTRMRAASAPQPAPARVASAPRDAPAPVASAAQAPSAQAEAGPRAQSEFGFER